MQGDQYLTIKTRAGDTRQALIGMGDVLDRLTDLAEIVGDLSPAWDELGRLWVRHMTDVFDSANGGQWQGFAPSTIAEHQSPLVDEGIMREGMIDSRPRYNDEHMVVFGPPKGRPRVTHVATLNTVGHRRGSTQVPPRPVVPRLSSGERRQWLGVIEDHIRKAIR